jgi:hypothetical protein
MTTIGWEWATAGFAFQLLAGLTTVALRSEEDPNRRGAPTQPSLNYQSPSCSEREYLKMIPSCCPASPIGSAASIRSI